MENSGSTMLLVFASILANANEMIGAININQAFTVVLSLLSIIYLLFGIYIRALEIGSSLKKHKEEEQQESQS